MIPIVAASAWMIRVASMQSIFGIRKSHQDHIGLQPPCEFDRLRPVALGDHPDVGFRLEQRAHGLAHDGVIIYQDNAHRVHVCEGTALPGMPVNALR